MLRHSQRYGVSVRSFHIRTFTFILCSILAMPVFAKSVTIVALGDSLTAGYQLPASAALPAVLERNLRAKGLDLQIQNAGVSGDTASGSLKRLD